MLARAQALSFSISLTWYQSLVVAVRSCEKQAGAAEEALRVRVSSFSFLSCAGTTPRRLFGSRRKRSPIEAILVSRQSGSRNCAVLKDRSYCTEFCGQKFVSGASRPPFFRNSAFRYYSTNLYFLQICRFWSTEARFGCAELWLLHKGLQRSLGVCMQIAVTGCDRY